MNKRTGRRWRLIVETPVKISERTIVAEIRPAVLIVRLKGSRYSYPIPWEQVWNRFVAPYLAQIAVRKRRLKDGQRI